MHEITLKVNKKMQSHIFDRIIISVPKYNYFGKTFSITLNIQCIYFGTTFRPVLIDGWASLFSSVLKLYETFDHRFHIKDHCIYIT